MSADQLCDRLLTEKLVVGTLMDIDIAHAKARDAAGDMPNAIREPRRFNAALRMANDLHRKLERVVAFYVGTY